MIKLRKKNGAKGVEKYNELINSNPGKYFPANQFGNPDNTKIQEIKLQLTTKADNSKFFVYI